MGSEQRAVQVETDTCFVARFDCPGPHGSQERAQLIRRANAIEIRHMNSYKLVCGARCFLRSTIHAWRSGISVLVQHSNNSSRVRVCIEYECDSCPFFGHWGWRPRIMHDPEPPLKSPHALPLGLYSTCTPAHVVPPPPQSGNFPGKSLTWSQLDENDRPQIHTLWPAWIIPSIMVEV